MSSEVVKLLQQAISILQGSPTGQSSAKYPPVFDLQPLGYTKLGAAETIREEFLDSGEKLKLSFAAKLPVWWYVQDAEDYATMNESQKNLQEFNCGNARFTMAIMRLNPTDPTTGRSALWRSWWQAVSREWDDDQQRFVDTNLIHTDGNPVAAVSNDSRTPGGRLLDANPRVVDMRQVILASYDYYYKTNVNAVYDVESVYQRDK
jgi:hypothetical protein